MELVGSSPLCLTSFPSTDLCWATIYLDRPTFDKHLISISFIGLLLGLLLGQRRRPWANSEPTLGQRLTGGTKML